MTGVIRAVDHLLEHLPDDKLMVLITRIVRLCPWPACGYAIR